MGHIGRPFGIKLLCGSAGSQHYVSWLCRHVLPMAKLPIALPYRERRWQDHIADQDDYSMLLVRAAVLATRAVSRQLAVKHQNCAD